MSDSEDEMLDLYKTHAYLPHDAENNPLTPFGNFAKGYELAWQARGELDAVKIKELQDKLDKARDRDCCTEGCIKCDARKILAETQEAFDVVQDSKGNLVPLYTTPPSREWVGLSDRELFNLSQQCDLNHILGLIDYGRAIEAKLREKNK